MPTEAQYQAKLRKKIEARLPGCVILKNDAQLKQGIPDLTIFHGSRWAMLEVKRSEDEPFQPNQEHYVRALHTLSFCEVIFPENEEEVLSALERSLLS